MKSFVSFMILCMVTMPTFAATSSTSRLGIVKSPIAAANKAAPTKIASMKVNLAQPTATESETDKSSVRYEDNKATIPPEPEIDRREKEKAACIQNNIGVGNTFVWASRYSNTNDYSTMIEDLEQPENNTCFVKVGLKSTDERINLGDIRDQYFEMGRNITCGAWADEGKLEQRILDAKKKARTWATVGGAVGGAALGVGSMELFGNRWIGGAVEGQKDKSLSQDELLRSQLLVLKKDNSAQYNEIVKHLESLQKECASDVWADAEKPDVCGEHNYEYLLSVKNAK